TGAPSPRSAAGGRGSVAAPHSSPNGNESAPHPGLGTELAAEGTRRPARRSAAGTPEEADRGPRSGDPGSHRAASAGFGDALVDASAGTASGGESRDGDAPLAQGRI